MYGPRAKGHGPKFKTLQNLQGVEMANIASFHDLIVWQKAMDLAEEVHRATAALPASDRYGIGSQVRRAAISIPANVAEGFSRRSRGAYRSHVAIALGSHAEVRTLLELLRRLSLLKREIVTVIEELAVHVGKLLYGLWRALALKSVCYSVGVGLLFLGLGPWALGLVNGLSLFS
jgi:four helix bundle protein